LKALLVKARYEDQALLALKGPQRIAQGNAGNALGIAM
jgi:hypothetical protein